MRIVQLAPGVGQRFYCENCLRDCALLRALCELGHDALAVPLYLPVVADEPSYGLRRHAAHGHDGLAAHRWWPRRPPIFFGGINIFLQEKFPFLRRMPRLVKRFLDTPALLGWVAKFAGMTTPRDLARTTLSMLEGEHGRQRRELERLVKWLRRHARPDVLILSNALLIGLARRLRQALKVPVLCLLQDEDAFLDDLPEPYRSQAWQIVRERAGDVDAFVPVSRYYGDVMTARLGLDPQRVHVIYSGIRLEDYAPAAARPARPTIGFLERMCREKGLDLLVEALILLKQRGHVHRPLLRVSGGSTAKDELFLAELHQRLADWELGGDVEFLPNLPRPEKVEFLRSLSVLSVPARRPEAFGMYVLEALACGVPVVAPRHGALPELLEGTCGGLLCKPNDAQALAVALEAMLLDENLAGSMTQHGREAVKELFGIDRMARQITELCERLAGPQAAR